jgi:hypothetical protein
MYGCLVWIRLLNIYSLRSILSTIEKEILGYTIEKEMLNIALKGILGSYPYHNIKNWRTDGSTEENRNQT